MFWIGGRLREVDAHGGSTVFLLGKAIKNLFAFVGTEMK